MILLLIAQLASVQGLNEQLLASRSATATLEAWCRDHHLADPPRIVAKVVDGVAKRPTADQLKRLAVTSAHDVMFRHVRLACGTHVLSEADNWYVPSRLTQEMNRSLDTTDTPFGKAVAALEPTRETIGTTVSSQPGALFEIRAVLYTRDHQPFSEVAEVYQRGLLDDDVQSIRSARIAQNGAIAAGDLDRTAAYWTDDVTVRRGLGSPMTGKAEVRKAFEPPKPPDANIVYQRLTTDVSVSPQWPLAYESGTWEGHLNTLTGAVVIGGQYSAQWVKRNGRWLIRSEVFVALTCSGVGCQSAALP